MFSDMRYFCCNNLKYCFSGNAIFQIQMEATESKIFEHFEKIWRLAGDCVLPAFLAPNGLNHAIVFKRKRGCLWISMLQGCWSIVLPSHWKRSYLPRNGLLCQRGPGRGFRHVQIIVVIYLRIKYVEHKHEVLNPFSERGISV